MPEKHNAQDGRIPIAALFAGRKKTMLTAMVLGGEPEYQRDFFLKCRGMSHLNASIQEDGKTPYTIETEGRISQVGQNPPLPKERLPPKNRRQP